MPGRPRPKLIAIHTTSVVLKCVGYVDNTPAPADRLPAGSWVYPRCIESRGNGLGPDIAARTRTQPEQRAPVALCPGCPTYGAVIHVFGLVFWYSVANIPTIIRIFNDVPITHPWSYIVTKVTDGCVKMWWWGWSLSGGSLGGRGQVFCHGRQSP